MGEQVFMYENIAIPADAKAAHAVIMAKYEEGLDEGASLDLALLLELVEDSMMVNEKGILLVPSNEFNFQSAAGSMVQEYVPMIAGMEVLTAPFGGLLSITERDMRMEQLGLISSTAKEVGVRAANRKGDAVRAGVPNLINAKTLGGTNFFSQTQLIDPAKGAAAGTYPNLYNLACNATNYEKVRSDMAKRKGPNGIPRRTKPTHFLHSSNLKATAKAIVGLEQIPGVAQGNPNYDPSVKLVEIEDFPDGAWMLASNKGTVKPLGYHATLAPRVMYFGIEKNGLVLNHQWRADVEDVVVGQAAWKVSWSQPGVF
jgi:hypothetical protein